MDIALVFLACAAIVGVIEWVKYLVKTAPALVWHIVLLPLAVAAALLLPVPLPTRLLYVGVVLLITQVGYQLIIQGAIGIVRGWVARAQNQTQTPAE